MSRTFFISSLLLAAVSAHTAEFPEGSAVPSAEEIKQRLSDKKFGVTLANGVTWRIEFKSSGHFFLDTSTGARAAGEWRPENGRLCAKLRNAEENCNDGRVFENYIHFKRADGEIIRYVPR